MTFAQIVSDTGPDPLIDLELVATNLLRAATAIAGIGVFVMFLAGAFAWLTAGSNQEKAQKAKQTFTYAAFGAGALIIVWFLFVFLKDYTGIDLFKFNICIIDDAYCNF